MLELVQPAVLVAVAVYVVVVEGDAVTVAPEVVFRPVDGLHVNEVGCTVEIPSIMFSLVVLAVPVTDELATRLCKEVVAEVVLVCASKFLLSEAAVK